MGGVCFVCVVCVVFIGESRSCVVVVYFCLCVSYRGVILYGDCVSCVCWGRVFCCGPRSMITYVVLMSSFHVALLSSCLVMFFVVVVVLSCSLLVVVVMSWSSCWCRVTRCLSRESIRQDIFIDQEQETYDIKVQSLS